MISLRLLWRPPIRTWGKYGWCSQSFQTTVWRSKTKGKDLSWSSESSVKQPRPGDTHENWLVLKPKTEPDVVWGGRQRKRGWLIRLPISHLPGLNILDFWICFNLLWFPLEQDTGITCFSPRVQSKEWGRTPGLWWWARESGYVKISFFLDKLFKGLSFYLWVSWPQTTYWTSLNLYS